RRERLAGSPRGLVSAGADRQPRHRGRRSRTAACGEIARARSRQHLGARAAPARRLRAQPDVADHRGARGCPRAGAAPVRYRHGVLLRGRGPGRQSTRAARSPRDVRPGHATSAALAAEGGIRALHVSHVAYPDLAFDTPSGKVEFVSERAAGLGLPALPVFETAKAPAYPLALRTGRTLTHFHAFYDHG